MTHDPLSPSNTTVGEGSETNPELLFIVKRTLTEEKPRICGNSGERNS